MGTCKGRDCWCKWLATCVPIRLPVLHTPKELRCAHIRYLMETKDKTNKGENKRSPHGNSKDPGAPQGNLCTKSMGNCKVQGQRKEQKNAPQVWVLENACAGAYVCVCPLCTERATMTHTPRSSLLCYSQIPLEKIKTVCWQLFAFFSDCYSLCVIWYW